MGPMQHSLTTATPLKSQKILFKARALGSNLIHRRLSTSQLPILDPPFPVTWFTSFLPCPPTHYGLPPPSFARFCDTRISSFKIYLGQQNTTLDPLSNREYTCFKQHKQVKCKKMMNAPLLLNQVSIFKFSINLFVWLLSSIKHQSHLWQSDSESEWWGASELHSWWTSCTYNLLDQTF